MNVVHLITSPIGGAATAAIRLNEALVQAGVESSLLTIERRNITHERDDLNQLKATTAKLLSSGITLFQAKLIQKSTSLVTPISLDLLDWEDSRIQNADVIHLHAFYNLVSIRKFLNKYPDKAKIVTLHDERFYSGGCHYTEECHQLESGCQNCPQVTTPFRGLVASQRRKIINEIRNTPNLFVICPSDWILKRAKSALPGHPPRQFFKIFNPIPKPEAQNYPLQKSINKIRLAFISQDLDNPVKNLKLLLGAFASANKQSKDSFSLTLVGNSKINYTTQIPLVSQTSVQSLTALQDLLSEIDLLVVPSTHDNLPSVLGEALMSGVSLLGSDVGGIPEIASLFDQATFENGREESLVKAILRFKPVNRRDLQNRATAIFGYETISSQMITVYKTAIRQIVSTTNQA